MELLPEELRKSLPPLYSQEGNDDPTVHIKFFTPDSNWTWFVTEGSEEDGDFRFLDSFRDRKTNGSISCFQSLKQGAARMALKSSATSISSPVPFSRLHV